MYIKNEKQHNEIYEKLVSILGIKFKVQLNNSPIEFKKLFFVQNLIQGIEFYSLDLKNKSIQFNSKDEFIFTFIKYLKSELKELEEEFEYLENLDQGINYDENYVYERHEYIGHGSYKIQQIIDKLEKYI